MAIILIVTGLISCFFYYALLSGLASGTLKHTRFHWFCCVGGSSFLLSLSLTVVAQYFGAKPTLWLSLALWPLIFLAFQSGYQAAISHSAISQTSAEENAK